MILNLIFKVAKSIFICWNKSEQKYGFFSWIYFITSSTVLYGIDENITGSSDDPCDWFWNDSIPILYGMTRNTRIPNVGVNF